MHLSLAEIVKEARKQSMGPIREHLQALSPSQIIESIPLAILLANRFALPEMVTALLPPKDTLALFHMRCYLKAAIQAQLIKQDFSLSLDKIREISMDSVDKIERSIIFYQGLVQFADKQSDRDLAEFLGAFNSGEQGFIVNPFAQGEWISGFDTENIRYFVTKKGRPFCVEFTTLSDCPIPYQISSKKAILSESKLKRFNFLQQGHSIMLKQGTGMLRQSLVLNFMITFKKLLEGVGIILWPYRICPLGEDRGMVELIQQTMSVDEIKRQEEWGGSLLAFYESAFQDQFQVARQRFIRSLVGYSLFTYVCQVKDRHNGNILVHSSGCIIHIDFTFSLGLFPGKIMAAERAPFKLTKEYVAMMGGLNSPGFQLFKQLLERGLQQLIKHKETVLGHMQLLSDEPCDMLLEEEIDAEDLIEDSYNNGYTTMYDNYQHMTNGIKP